jgi:short-subunit dehydrogenase
MSLPRSTEAGDTVVVTGASSGIGADLARELAARGYGTTLVARREERLRELAAELEGEHGVTVDVRACDLVDDAERRALADELAGGERRVIGLCNNAGVGSMGDVAELDPDHEVRIVRLNALALHELTVRLLPTLVEGGEAAILNLASVTGFQPLPGTATYAATKAFVISFSEALHAELSGTGVSCTVVSPGLTRTEIWGESGAGELHEAGPGFLWQDAEQVARASVSAMVEGRRTVVPGVHNKLASVGGRFVPRSVWLPAMRTVGGRRLVALFGNNE